MASIESVINRKIKRLKEDLRQISVGELAPFMDMEMRKAIMDAVYSRHPSDYYDRTMGLLNSTTTSVNKHGDGLMISVFNDPSLMNSPHSSWVTGEDQRESIPMWISRGHGGIVSYEATNYENLAYRNIISEKKYIKILKDNLKKRGYTID